MRFFIILVVTLGFAAPAVAEDCSLKEAASFDMLDGHPSRVVVPLSIAGKPSPFIVDTGGFATGIFDDVASGLGVEMHPVDRSLEIYDVRGAQVKSYTKIPNLMIGKMKGDDIQVLVFPRANHGEAGIDGILGPDILSKFDADFDFTNRKLNLILPDHCAGKAVYWSQEAANVDFHLSGPHIVLTMTLDNHDVRAMLDTGSPQTHLSESVARSLFGLTATSPGMEPIPGIAPGALEQFRYRFKQLSIGGLAINNPLIYILPDRVQQSFDQKHFGEERDPFDAVHLSGPDVILGMDVISKLHLYVAYRERKIYLTAAAAH